MGVTGRPRTAAWVRAADEVTVLVGGLGYLTVTKRVARRLLQEKPDRVTAEFVPELGLLLIDPRTPGGRL